MKNKYLLGAIVLIIIIAGVAFFLLYQNKTGGQEAQISQDQKDELQTNDKAKESVETIDLKTVGGYEGSGSATRVYNGTNFVHMVIAKLDESAEGKFYEGWLVKKEPTVTFISTGKLAKEGGEEYVLLFTNETDYSDYNDVVITEETESLGLDNNPETHVLEGSFSN